MGNIVSGQVTGDTAKLLSDRFGKIMQPRESLSVNSSDTSISHSGQLDFAIPPSKIASLSSGEFVGMVTDNPNQTIDLKTFHATIQNDHVAIRKEESGYIGIPEIRTVTSSEVMAVYLRIKAEVMEILGAA